MPYILEKMPPSPDGFAESRLAAFQMQMKEVMSDPNPSSFSVTTPHHHTYSAGVPQPAQTVP